jgi:hypothetical protein
MVYIHESKTCEECRHEVPSSQRLCRSCFESKKGRLVNWELDGEMMGLTLVQEFE